MFFTVIALKYALLASYSDHTDILINQRIECYLNNTITLRSLTPHIMPCYTHKMAIVSWRYILRRHLTVCIWSVGIFHPCWTESYIQCFCNKIAMSDSLQRHTVNSSHTHLFSFWAWEANPQSLWCVLCCQWEIFSAHELLSACIMAMFFFFPFLCFLWVCDLCVCIVSLSCKGSQHW